MKNTIILNTLKSLSVIGVLFVSTHAWAFGGDITLSSYHWNEPGGVNEVGVKLGLSPNPITLSFLTPRLTYEPEIDLMFLRYHGSNFYNTLEKYSEPSFHLMLDNNLAYKFYQSTRLSFSVYGGLHYIFRDIDPSGEHQTIENYIEPRVGLRTSYNFTQKDSIELNIYRPIKVWQYSTFGVLNLRPSFGYKGLITHQLTDKYDVSLYGEYTQYNSSSIKEMSHSYGYFYQPKIKIIQAGIQMQIKY